MTPRRDARLWCWDRPSSRAHHWDLVRCAAGLGQLALYTCTRHFLASYALNILRLDPHDIGLQLGHRDGGALYGHPDAVIARQRIQSAYEGAPTMPVRFSAHRELVTSPRFAAKMSFRGTRRRTRENASRHARRDRLRAHAGTSA